MSEAELDQKIETALRNSILETNAKNRLKNLLFKRLSDSGWKNRVKKRCTENIRTKGVNNIKLDQLEDEVLAYEIIPEDVKIELLQQISDLLDETK
ncbi:18680_t:CDS:2 [Dentiscutata erythropus]|uniref:18680_t:CDS:1 n=1 Tax=Dentiscutata erythropus TaxID=1348616 RepID=A0A9N9FU02_9GLOM|nr:18680_t:CDS:2 [Dentiscutata erythropus]